MNSLRACVLRAVTCLTFAARAVDDYPLGPDSLERAAGVPGGCVEPFQFTGSKVLPETARLGQGGIPVVGPPAAGHQPNAAALAPPAAVPSVAPA